MEKNKHHKIINNVAFVNVKKTNNNCTLLFEASKKKQNNKNDDKIHTLIN